MLNCCTDRLRKILLLTLITLVALALPVGLAVWGIHSFFASPPPPATEDPAENPALAALRASLEAVVDKNLPAPEGTASLGEWTLAVADPAKAAKNSVLLATELGGLSLEGHSDTKSHRIVFSIPADKFPEFARRIELLTGQKFPTHEIDGIFTITFAVE